MASAAKDMSSGTGEVQVSINLPTLMGHYMLVLAPSSYPSVMNSARIAKISVIMAASSTLPLGALVTIKISFLLAFHQFSFTHYLQTSRKPHAATLPFTVQEIAKSVNS